MHLFRVAFSTEGYLHFLTKFVVLIKLMFFSPHSAVTLHSVKLPKRRISFPRSNRRHLYNFLILQSKLLPLVLACGDGRPFSSPWAFVFLHQVSRLSWKLPYQFPFRILFMAIFFLVFYLMSELARAVCSRRHILPFLIILRQRQHYKQHEEPVGFIFLFYKSVKDVYKKSAWIFTPLLLCTLFDVTLNVILDENLLGPWRTVVHYFDIYALHRKCQYKFNFCSFYCLAMHY